MQDTTRRLERIALIALSALLAFGCLIVLRPFIPAILWALILALATWPALEWIERRLRVSRSIASLFLTILFLLAMVLPLVLVSFNLVDNVTRFYSSVRTLFEEGVPPPPAWLANLPYAGRWISENWNEFLSDGPRVLTAAKRLLEPAKDMLLAGGAYIGQFIFQFLVSLLMLFFIYRHGEDFHKRLQVAASKVAGERSRKLLLVAGNTLQSAIYGIVGTAFAQGILAGVGFLIAGVPAPFLLALFTFALSPIPGGPVLIWGGAVVWFIYHGIWGWGLFMLVWGALVISSVDNFIRPYIMSRGTNLPLVLILLGVLGGALAFGALGIFVGPALLAVAYTALKEWSESTSAN